VIPKFVRFVLEGLGIRRTGDLSDTEALAFFTGRGVKGRGFIGFSITRFGDSPRIKLAVAFFFLTGTFGTLNTLEVLGVAVESRRCIAKTSWIQVAASFNFFSISSSLRISEDGVLQEVPEIFGVASVSIDGN
jgi:hypothetical protein